MLCRGTQAWSGEQVCYQDLSLMQAVAFRKFNATGGDIDTCLPSSSRSLWRYLIILKRWRNACRPWSLRHSQQGDRSLNSASLPTFYQREPRACRLCQVMNPQGEFNHSGGSINQNTYNWLTYLHSKFWIATLELDWTCLDAREVGFWRLCGSLPPLWSLRWCGPWVCVARLLRLCRSLIWSALCSSRKSCKFILIFFSQCRCQNDQPYADYYLMYHLQDFASSHISREYFVASCVSMYSP